MPTGLIVAGGRSTRFDETDKALAGLAGRPLVAHVAQGLESSVDELLVSCRDEQREAIAIALSEIDLPVSFVVDDREIGPLGGICDGLQASDSEWTFVVGCDFPFVDESVFRLLTQSASHDAVVFRYPDGGVQPLCGRYRTEPARQQSQQLLAADDRRARRLVEQLSTRYVDVSAHSGLTGRLENINTPTELAAAESRRADGQFK